MSNLIYHLALWGSLPGCVPPHCSILQSSWITLYLGYHAPGVDYIGAVANTCRCSNVTNSCSVFLIIRLVGLAVYAQDSAHPAGLPLMCGSVGRVPGWSALGLNPVQGS